MKKYFDEFVRLPLSKMSKKLSEMTYLYNNTEVPEKHYKELLDESILELMDSDSMVQSVLLHAVTNTLKALEKESPKLFRKALICFDNNIKTEELDARTYYALDMAYDLLEQNKKMKLLNQGINDQYQQAYQNGLPQTTILFDETDKERS